MKKINTQLVRYAIVGFASNLIFYLIYVLLNQAWGSPRSSMSLVFLFAVILTFVFNSKWTFDTINTSPVVFARYLLVYLLGYFVNLGGLYYFVDILKLPHQWIQLVMIFFVAGLIFTLQRLWVFGGGESRS